MKSSCSPSSLELAVAMLGRVSQQFSCRLLVDATPHRGAFQEGLRRRRRTATPAINHGKRRHSAALSEFGTPLLNGVQRSVNRKVNRPGFDGGCILWEDVAHGSTEAPGGNARLRTSTPS